MNIQYPITNIQRPKLAWDLNYYWSVVKDDAGSFGRFESCVLFIFDSLMLDKIVKELLIINGDTSAKLFNVLCNNLFYDNKVVLWEAGIVPQSSLMYKVGDRLRAGSLGFFCRRFSACCGNFSLPGKDLFSEVKFWDFEIRADCFVGIMAG